MGWSWARLITFGVAVWALYLLGGSSTAAVAVLAVGLGLFAFSVRVHGRARSARELAERVILVLEESAKRIGGTVALVRGEAEPPSSEAAALPIALEEDPTWAMTDQERDDLDLFAAPVGMFGLLNRTSTVLGARRLAQMLNHPCLSIEHILRRQETVRCLEQHPAERNRMMGATAGLRGKDAYLDRLVRAIQSAEHIRFPIPLSLMRLWTAVAAVTTCVAVVQAAVGHYRWGMALCGLLIINLSLYAAWRRRFGCALEIWKDLGPVTRGYMDSVRQARVDLPDQTDLDCLRRAFAGVSSRSVLPRLCGWIGWADVGGVFHELFNVLFFYDVHVLTGILGCAIPNRAALLMGLSSLAELEAVASLACFAWEQPVKCYPTPVVQPGVTMTACRHALLPPERAVPNDFELSATTRVWIVTGPNMAGKSTLLRTVGTNILLAQIGTVATTETMQWSPVRLITDLQARDNLADDESYFLAEVRHVLRMVSPPDGAEPILGLLDEPFRGTNTKERIAASVAVVERLMASRHFLVVATHEPALTRLVDDCAAPTGGSAQAGSVARNVHFHEHLEDNAMVFDYQLRSGPAVARNALLVLEREGFPESIIARAHEWIDDNADPGPRVDDPGFPRGITPRGSPA